MKLSVVTASTQNIKQNFKRFGFAESAARKLLSIFVLVALVFVASCASTNSNGAANGPTNSAPAISLQPTSVTATSGATATFAAVAAGTPTPTVQWQVSTNGGTSFAAVAGATSTTFSFTTAASQNGNVYEAVFTNSASSVTSTAAMLTVNSAPVIATNPANVSVTALANATFTAAATGTPAPTVQWQVSTNGGTTFANLSGATSPTLTFVAMTALNGNQYKAAFTNSVSTATTTAATLTINLAPIITTSPANVTVIAGAIATFIAAATGAPTPTVQWQVSTNGGTTFTNLGGATSSTLTFAPTAALNGNQYKAVFTNSVNSATTATATLVVNFAPVITTNPVNVSVGAGNTATFTATAIGQPAPAVQWMVSSDGGATFTSISGATSTTLSFTTSLGMNANVYEGVFTNVAGSVTTTAASLTVNTAPTITLNPVTLTIESGGTAVFMAAATGSPAPTVQWFVSTNGGASFNAIVGATSTTFSFTASLAQSGNLYQAVFTNSASASTTTTALLTVTAAVIVSVAITNPSSSPVTLGTGAILNFSAAITNGTAGTGVNWSVGGVAGGNSTVGMITASTQDGASATYMAPATAPGNAVTIVATYAGAGSAASEPVTVNVVTNHNATLSGQFAFQVRGYQVSGLPFAMIGTFTADGSGTLSNVLIDTNSVQTAGAGSAFTSKVAWNGSYSMDSTSHGIMHLTLTGDPNTQINFGFTFSGGNGVMVEIDTPLGSTASGTFSAATASSFTLASGGLNGTYVMRLEGPSTGIGDGFNGILAQVTFAPTGSSTIAGTAVGSMTFNDGSTSNIVPSAVVMDADGSGHASIAITLDNSGGITLSAYVSSSGRIFTLDSDSTTDSLTGTFRSQTIPVGGFTAANIFTSAMFLEAIGVDPTTNHASAIIGGFSPSADNPTTQVVGEFDANDGGSVPVGSPVQFTGAFTVDPTVPGLGTLAFTNGPSFVFYMWSPGEGFILEVTAVNSASRIGQIGAQTEPGGGFVLATLNGTNQSVGTVTTTPASTNGVAAINFGSGTYVAATDSSSLAQSPFITGTSTGTVAFTDAVRGRGTITPVAGSIFGAASVVFYTINNSGALIMISVDATTLEPQIIMLGN
jgi:hypothetical protein